MLPLLTAIAPIVGAGIGALGSLLAPKPKAVKNSIDLKGLRDDAEAAGFNPLTIIRGGGLAGYGISPAGPDMRLSNALMTFGSGVAAFNPMGALRDQAELDLARAQIKSIGTSGVGGASGNLSFQTPKAVATGPNPAQVFDNPIGSMVSGGWTPADDWNSMYGEAVGDTAGVLNWLSDYQMNTPMYDFWGNHVSGPRIGSRDPDNPTLWFQGKPVTRITTGGGF